MFVFLLRETKNGDYLVRMKANTTGIRFSDCDDNLPQGEWTGYQAATAEDIDTLLAQTQDAFIAIDDTGVSEKTGQGPYYLYLLP